MEQFKQETTEDLERFVRENLLSETIFPDLLKATSINHVILIFQKYISINELTEPKIWSYIINKYMELDEVLRPAELLIFREIIRHDGVVLKFKCKESVKNYGITTYQYNKGIINLEDDEFIYVLEFQRKDGRECKDKIVIVHPKFRIGVG